MVEVWKDIKGYEGLYQVSNLGRVKSLPKDIDKGKYIAHYGEKVWKLSNPKYRSVDLRKNGVSERKTLHRLVAEAFVPNPLNYPIVNHKDENPFNNRADNLEWCTQSYNINYGNRNKKVADKMSKEVIQLNKDGKLISTYKSLTEAYLITGIHFSNISNCCKGKRPYAGGFIWKYSI